MTYSELDVSKNEQVITYSVSDSSGNTATAELKVTLVDPVIASPVPSATAPGVDGTSTNSSSTDPAQGNTAVPSQNKVPSGTRTGETKYYWFTDGYDIDSAYNAWAAVAAILAVQDLQAAVSIHSGALEGQECPAMVIHQLQIN